MYRHIHTIDNAPAVTVFVATLADGIQCAGDHRIYFNANYDKRDKIDRIALWGVNDVISWKNNYNVPGRTNYPWLFDRDYQPKPAVEVIVDITE